MHDKNGFYSTMPKSIKLCGKRRCCPPRRLKQRGNATHTRFSASLSLSLFLSPPSLSLSFSVSGLLLLQSPFAPLFPARTEKWPPSSACKLQRASELRVREGARKGGSERARERRIKFLFTTKSNNSWLVHPVRSGGHQPPTFTATSLSLSVSVAGLAREGNSAGSLLPTRSQKRKNVT